MYELNRGIVFRRTAMGVFYIDGKYVNEDEAVLPVDDLAVLRGYGVFDFMRTYGGRPFRLDDHIRRLQNSAALIQLSCPWSLEEIRAIVEQTMERNGYEESNVRLLVTGGESGDSITPGDRPRLLVMVTPVKAFPGEWYREGVKVVTSDITRYIPGAKSIDYIRAILALNNARQQDAVESIYVDSHEVVLEGTTSNIFVVADGRVLTPPEDILPGVTRQAVLEIIEDEFSPELETITRQTLYGAEEVFLTSSNKEVLPVVRVDDRTIGNGQPGSATRRIMELFRNHTDQYGVKSA